MAFGNTFSGGGNGQRPRGQQAVANALLGGHQATPQGNGQGLRALGLREILSRGGPVTPQPQRQMQQPVDFRALLAERSSGGNAGMNNGFYNKGLR